MCLFSLGSVIQHSSEDVLQAQGIAPSRPRDVSSLATSLKRGHANDLQQQNSEVPNKRPRLGSSWPSSHEIDTKIVEIEDSSEEEMGLDLKKIKALEAS